MREKKTVSKELIIKTNSMMLARCMIGCCYSEDTFRGKQDANRNRKIQTEIEKFHNHITIHLFGAFSFPGIIEDFHVFNL